MLDTLLGKAAEAMHMAQLAWNAAIEAGDLGEQGWAQLYLNATRSAVGDPPADEAVDEPLRLFEKCGNLLGLHVARTMRAVHWHGKGRFGIAAASSTDVFGTSVGTEIVVLPVDDNNLAYLLLRSARNLVALGDLDEALRQSEEALELFAVHGAVMGRARAFQACGVVLQAQGEHEKARIKLSNALELFEQTSNAGVRCARWRSSPCRRRR
ncbi:tetratricopeptide repeat protein [Lentzea jiangxiensis]|uniref:tetratricopeptide repeat protein n=1 Tax=Lentzea jiangxiensis TaxID=641025 RepID=UPI00115FB2BC|nr:tetratricopeptide repeat protein [Lentzea jiangxiensis]